ncbi:hypothetical protein PspLS_09255 [Pyricularia sp. CBS 133598]|nr:hypothetical protein PspLS_09255 [Pyricularia sp. CBS 133598]
MAPKARLVETPLLPVAPVLAGVPAEVVVVAVEVAAEVLEAAVVVAAAAAILDEYAARHVLRTSWLLESDSGSGPAVSAAIHEPHSPVADLYTSERGDASSVGSPAWMESTKVERAQNAD